MTPVYGRSRAWTLVAPVVLAGSIADPTQLPLAASGGGSVLPDLAAVGALQAAEAAGGDYVDPDTGVTVVRLTSNSSPAAGSWEPSYSEGGPSCSQPWIGAGGKTFYTIMVRTGGTEYLIDIQYDLIGVSDPRSNMRTVTVSGEIGLAFSLNPATPRICYIIDSGNKRVNRYDTAINANANSGNFPWNIAAAGTAVDWLHTQLDDDWLALLLNSNQTICAFRPSDGAEISLTVAESGAGSVDELRLDREDHTLYVVGGGHGGPRRIWHLDTDSVTEATDLNPPLLHFEHAGPIRGGIAMHCCATQDVNETPSGGVVYRSDLNQTINFVPTPDGTHTVIGDFYTEGHWCMNLPTQDRSLQWVTAHLFAAPGQGAGNKIRNGMMAWVKLTGEVRLIACHGSQALVYDTYPQCFTSPDGKLLFWTSDMNNSGRFDAFMAKMPVS